MSFLKPIAIGAIASLVLLSLIARAPADEPPVTVKCNAFKIKEAWRAKYGKFLVKNGLTEEDYSGNVGRRKLKINKGCQLEATAGDNILLVFDDKAKRKLSRSSGFQMQCVDAVKPTGKFLGYNVAPKVSSADGKSWTPPCEAIDLNAAEKKLCSKGVSNSERWDHWKARAEKAKTFAIDFSINSEPDDYARPDEPLVGTDRKRTKVEEVAPSGKLFCQYFDSEDKNVLFTVTFEVPKG